jgi:hypothetical protein
MTEERSVVHRVIRRVIRKNGPASPEALEDTDSGSCSGGSPPIRRPDNRIATLEATSASWGEFEVS